MAGTTGLEPATFGVTGRRSNQLNYAPIYNQNKLRAGQDTVNGSAVFAVPGFALFFESFERAAHQLSFERADAVDKEFSVKVVDFVL